MWDRNPVRSSLVHMLPAIADRHGVALAPLLTRAGLPADETFAGDVVARAQICTLLHHLAQQAGEPTIGLDLAASADPARLGLMGRALFAGRTLRDCLSAMAAQMPSLQGGVSLSLVERGPTARWSHRMADSDDAHARVLNEGVTAFMVQAITAIAGMDPAELGVDLPHRSPAPLRIYEDKLRTRVRFGSGGGIALTFSAHWLDLPNVLFEPSSTGGAGRPGETLSEAVWRDDEALLGAISLLFESAALNGTLSLADTARTLGIAPRSLQRRLAGLGTSFEQRVDVWRHRQACLSLADPAVPVGSIARALGYRHPAHFVRAFHRWEGRTPLTFRKAARTEDVPGDVRHLAPNGN